MSEAREYAMREALDGSFTTFDRLTGDVKTIPVPPAFIPPQP